MAFPTTIEHIFFIAFENHSYASIIKDGPYFKSLSNTYGRVTNYKEVCNPSLPNYMAITSGTTYAGKTNKCGTDSITVFDSKNIFSLCSDAGLTWKAYAEGMDAPCSNSGTKFVARHVPALFYTNIVGTDFPKTKPAYCITNVRPLSDFDSSVTPDNFVFITPDMCNDMHDCSVATGDTWLKGFLDPLLTKSWASKTVFIIWSEEGYGSPIYLVFVNDICKGNTFDTSTNNYQLLTTMEWILGLGSCGNSDNSTTYPPMTSLFSSCSNPTYDFELVG